MKKISFLFVLAFLFIFPCGEINGATVTKGLIGEQDISHSDGTSSSTFTRASSTGGTLTLNKVGSTVDALIVYGGGVNYTQATIQAGLTAIGTRHVKLTLRANPSGGWAISTPLAIPANVELDMPNGSYFTYSGTGAVTGLKGATPNMFGVNTTPGTTDMATAINRAIQAVSDGYVDIIDHITAIGASIIQKSNVILRGKSIATTLESPTSVVSDWYATTIKLLAASDCDMVTFGNTVVMSGLIGIGLDGNKANQTPATNTLYGIKFEDTAGSTLMASHKLENVGVHFVNGYGIYGGVGIREVKMTDVKILYNRREGLWLHNAIDWTGYNVGSGWNGNSAARFDGVGGTDSGSHIFIYPNFFGPDPSHIGGLNPLTDVFAADEAGSAVVMKGVTGGNQLYGGAIQGASRHGLYMLHADNTAYTSGTLTAGVGYEIQTYVSDDDFTNIGATSNATGVAFTATGTTPTHWAHGSTIIKTDVGLVPKNNLFSGVIINANGIETNNTYDQVRLYSLVNADPVASNQFISVKFFGGEGAIQPAYAINDQNDGANIAGNVVIGGKFDSSSYATGRFNNAVTRYWSIMNSANLSTDVVDVGPNKFSYRSITDNTGKVSTAIYTYDTIVDIALTAGDRTMTLPSYLEAPAGKIYIISKSDTTGAVLTVAPYTGEKIGNGAADAPIYISDNSSPLILFNEVGTWKVVRGIPSGKVTLNTLANSATPSVKGSNIWKTGGTTTITDFTDGFIGQEITILSDHSITITDGTNIFLSGSANFVMAATGTLRLLQREDGKWYEISRSAN